jgi:beta-1,2-mannosidase
LQHDQNVSVTFPLGPFVPASCNPIMAPGTAPHENGNVYNPAAVVRDGKVWLLYRAHGPDLVSRVCLASSEDGLNFTRRPTPVVEPTEPYETKGLRTARHFANKCDRIYVLLSV